MPTTWNPADLLNTTLSGGNLTTAPTAQGSVRSLASATTGKCYFEVTFNGAGVGAAVGAANATANLSTGISTGVSIALVNNGGACAINGTGQTGVPAFGTGNTCCIALDVGGQLIWFRNGAAGNWNGSGTANPATGAGGYSLSSLTGGATTLYGYAGGTSGTAAGTTANFGPSGFTGAVPAGFTAGFPAGAVATTQARAMVLA